MDFLASITKWKIWGVVGAVFAALLYGMKLRGDYYEDKAEKAEAETKVAHVETEVKSFEAVQLNEAAHVDEETAKLIQEANNEVDNDLIIDGDA